MTGSTGPISRSFFARHVLEVAPELLGKRLVAGEVVLEITEVEAYFWPGDTACHARHGPTARNRALFGDPGTAYVYRVYGLHCLLNLVTGSPGEPQAALVRAARPVAGLEAVAARRGGRRGPDALAGPGRVGAALALDPGWSGHPLVEPGGLEVRAGPAPSGVLVGPRVGIDYAEPEHRDAPWRWAVADTPWVSARATLRPA